MSNIHVDLNYQYYEWYLAECRALEIQPTMSDYSVWLQELDLDRGENYDV